MVAPLPVPEQESVAPNDQAATIPQELASESDINTPESATEAQRPEQPMQIAPTSYSVTSGNKLAEELKKANEQK